jgi:hypothetical protein
VLARGAPSIREETSWLHALPPSKERLNAETRPQRLAFRPAGQAALLPIRALEMWLVRLERITSHSKQLYRFKCEACDSQAVIPQLYGDLGRPLSNSDPSQRFGRPRGRCCRVLPAPAEIVDVEVPVRPRGNDDCSRHQPEARHDPELRLHKAGAGSGGHSSAVPMKKADPEGPAR